MEERKLRVMFNKDGRGAIGAKITLPMTYLKKMGVTPESREVNLKFDEENKKIIIEK